MRALAIAAVTVGCLLLAAAVGLFVKGIWTVGPDAGRYGGTGAVVLLVGAVLAFAGAAWLDLNPRGMR